MKKFICLILVISALCSSLTVFADEALTEAAFIYVAQNGDDGARGDINAPLKTVAAAVNKARGIDGTVVINLRGGDYQMTETVTLGKEDSDLVIRACKGEKVMLTGGTVLPFDAFRKCTDEDFLNALVTQSAKDKVISANIKELGVSDLGEIKRQGFISASDMGYSPTLTYNDRALTIARYPNEGYLYTETILSEGSSDDLYFKTETGAGARKIEYTIADKRTRQWSGKDLWALGYFRVDWAESLMPAELTKKGSIIGYIHSSHAPLPNRRVYFYNVPEELDAPGEWYLNRETGMLYMIPVDGMKSGDTLVFNSYGKNLFDIKGAKNVEISGIVFNGTCAMGINITESDGILIDNCEFTCIGDAAVGITKSTRSGVMNSYFHDLGSFGVRLTSCGDRYKLISGECFVKNSHFRTFSQIKRTYSPAVNISDDMGTVVSNCEFHDAPHFALHYNGNDIIIEYNDFYDVCQDTADTGAVYTGRYWETRGNQVRYNYFHDMTEVDTTTGMHKMAVYLDDTHCSTRVHGNVFYNIDSVALMGGGRYNQFTNNIMVDCKKPLVFDERGLTWQYEQAWLDKNAEGSTYKVLESFPYKEGIWNEKYPELATILEDDPVYPKYNTLKNNLFYRTPEFNLAENVKKYGTIEGNIELSSTKDFVDYRNKNFALKDNSEVFTKLPGFENIPFDKIGRYDYTPSEKYAEKSGNGVFEPYDGIKVLLNGEAIVFDVLPQIINDRTMVPLRAIFEALGANVLWDDATKTVTAVKGDITIKMTIGADSFIRNDESVALDSPATIVDSRTLVPVRAIAESFGSTVGWIAESKTVTIED